MPENRIESETATDAEFAGNHRATPGLLRKFFRLHYAKRLLVLEAVVSLAFARSILVAVPFGTLASRFGKMSVRGDISGQPVALTHAQKEIASDVGWAVTRAALYVPFRAVCLPQAIAAKRMLGNRNIDCVMHFGVKKRKGASLAAHAWLDAGDIEVTGYPLEPEFIELASFR